MASNNHLSTSLQQSGFRLTPQRIAICRVLGESPDHPTAAMIYEAVKAQYPSLSLMTVYNTLNALVDLGAVNELGSAGDGNVHYDGDPSPHINLACITCHKIIDIESPEITSLNDEIIRKSGFRLIGLRMMYYGFCPDCQKETKNNSN
jgi:Fur family peroxide stress response transcriptional regulator